MDSNCFDGLDVLVVDDDDLVRNAMVIALGSFGARPIEADDGDIALRILSSRDVDILVCDLVMPFDGAEVLSWAIRHRPFMAAVVASSHAGDPAVFNDPLIGQFASLRKPFRIAELQNALDNALKAAAQRRELFGRLYASDVAQCMLAPDGEIWMQNDAWLAWATTYGRNELAVQVESLFEQHSDGSLEDSGTAPHLVDWAGSGLTCLTQEQVEAFAGANIAQASVVHAK